MTAVSGHQTGYIRFRKILIWIQMHLQLGRQIRRGKIESHFYIVVSL